jgi:hypothetical protein
MALWLCVIPHLRPGFFSVNLEDPKVVFVQHLGGSVVKCIE